MSFSGFARVTVPLPKSDSTSADHNAQRPSKAPQGRYTAEENKLEDERQHHIHSPHQGHGSGFLYLQGLREEGLAGNAKDSDQHEHPAILTTKWDFPFPKDGYGDDALDESNDSIVPDREVVVDTLSDLAKDNHCTSSTYSSCEEIQKMRRQEIVESGKKQNMIMNKTRP